MPDATSPSPAAASPLTRTQRRLDFILIVVVMAFAFLSASFIARNNDLWMHLAAGRLLAHGDYRFGVDPFSYTTEGVYWSNNSWLFDVLFYGLHQSVGYAGMVAFKAALMAVLAAFLILVRRPGQGLGLPGLCTLLAVLTLSSRMLLQPIAFSFLLLGVTLWLLAAPAAPETQRRRWYLIPLVFILWPNLDSWFLLGPVLVFLFWLGELLQPAAGFTAVEVRLRRRTLLGALLVGLAVCLINPHHVHVFALPQEFSAALLSSGLAQDVRFQYLYVSPWQFGTYLQPQIGRSAAGLAYYVLFGLGLISFALNFRDVRWWRVFVWVVFCVLGALRVRTLPFFAVVAGPITALNLQDFVARRFAVAAAADLPRARSELRMTFGAIVAGWVLAVCTWPGWLQAAPHQYRRVAWDVWPDQTMREAAEAVAGWRRQGKLREGENGFLTYPDLGSYCAWFAPGEKSFIDQRYELFPADVIDEYETVCQTINPLLREDPTKPPPGAPGAWRSIFRRRGITHAVLYNPIRRLQVPELLSFWGQPQQWTMLYLGGWSVIFGWTPDAAATQHFADLRFEPRRLAFDHPPEAQARAVPPAPAQGPSASLTSAGQPADVWKPPSPRPWEAQTAWTYLWYFQSQIRPYQLARVEAGRAAFLASLFGENILPVPSPAAAIVASFHLRLVSAYMPQQTEGPSAPLFLAVRAARTARAADPRDAETYLHLGQAYFSLAHNTREKTWDDHLHLLRLIRQVQTATALREAVARQPDLTEAHQLLAQVYEEQRYFDVALEHYQKVLELIRQQGPQSGQSGEDFTKSVQQLEKLVDGLEKAVHAREDQFTLQSEQFGDRPLAKAQLAIGLGLTKKALEEILIPAPVEKIGNDGVHLELQLLLSLGQPERVRAFLDSEDIRQHPDQLGWMDFPAAAVRGFVPKWSLPAYWWIDLEMRAATGDYDLADKAVQAMLRAMGNSGRTDLQQLQTALARQLAMEIGQRTPGQPPFLAIPTGTSRETLSALVQNQALGRKLEEADVAALGGALMVERGLPDKAAAYFHQALQMWQPFRARHFDFWGRGLTEGYLRLIEDASK